MTTNTPARDFLSRLVDAFLGYHFPEDMAPDGGLSFKRPDPVFNPHWTFERDGPIGTNLLTADQARAMFAHCLAAAGYVEPPAPEADAVERVAKAIFDAHRARYPERICPAAHGWDAVEESTREHWRAVAAGSVAALGAASVTQQVPMVEGGVTHRGRTVTVYDPTAQPPESAEHRPLRISLE